MKAINIIYSKADKSAIDCEIEHPAFGWIPFTASPDDVEAHGRELFAMLQAGEGGPVAAYVPPTAPVPVVPVIAPEDLPDAGK